MDTREREQQIPSAPPNGKGPEVREETVTQEPRSRRPLFIIIGAIVAILAIVWGVRYFSYASKHQSTDDARVDANTVAITSKINERVQNILVDTNQPVKKGQLLVSLDNATETAAVAQAKANLQTALENQQAGITQGTGGVSQAQSNVQNAQAQVPVAQAGVQAAQAQVQAARAALPAAKEALNRASADFSAPSRS